MGSVWDRATEFLGDNIGTVMPIALGLIFLPASITDSIAPLGVSGSPMQLPISLANLALALVSLVGQLAIIALVLGVATAPGEAVNLGLRKLFSAFVFSLIWVLALVVALLPVIILVAFAGAGSKALASNDQAAVADLIAHMSPAALGSTALYMLLWVVGAIWISARLVLGFPAMLAEQIGLGAFRRSFDLTKRLVMKIVGVLVLYLIVSAVAALAAKAAFGGAIRLLVGDSGPMSLATVLTSIAVGAVGMIFSVLQAAFVAKLYVAACNRVHEDALSR